MTFARRTFPEVLDNMLTDITGGVAAESHPFPPDNNGAPFQHSLLQPPVADLISVYGLRDGQPRTFEKGVDYSLLPDRRTLAWGAEQKGARLPDPGTLFYVNYYPAATRRTLTDLQVGSVLRTVTETVALEMGRLYAQLQAVYDAGYIDTASGGELDNVVAILDVQRIQGGHPAGEVEFTRASGTRGVINIPAGTRVMTADGKVQYETTATITLAANQNTIRVIARDLRPNDVLPAGALSVLPVPMAGIAGVTNPAPTTILTQDESDDELRTRTKNFLHGSERATLGAINQALALQGVSAEVVEVPNIPGLVEISPHNSDMEPALQQRLLTAIEAVRPAGVQVVLKDSQPPKKVDLQLRLITNDSLLPTDRRAVQRTARDKLTDYFNKLPAKQPASVNKIVALVSAIPGVEDLRLLAATVDGASALDLLSGQIQVAGFATTLGNLTIADPGLPTSLDVVVTFQAGADAPDQAQTKTALSNMVAYLNNLNASDLPTNAPATEVGRRQLSFGKLLLATPLPTKPATSLEDYDKAVQAGTAPDLPNMAGIAPYQVQFVFTSESGQSKLLSADADTYNLMPFERLSLNNVQVG